MAEITHRAHRYVAPKACGYMVKYQDGTIAANDLLLDFISSLPNLESVGEYRLLGNKFGGFAQHFKFKTTLERTPTGTDFWHGTTFQCLPDILRDGLRNPYDMSRTFQEFKEVHDRMTTDM